MRSELSIKWIKLNVDMFSDEKIKLIEKMPEGDTLLIIWVKLLTQAGKANAKGYLMLSENIPYTDEMLSTVFDRPLPVVRMALQTFVAFGMIEIDENNFISITNWEKHQNIDGMEKVREQTRIRTERYRERKKLLQAVGSDATVTSRDALDIEIELDIEKEKDKEKSKRKKDSPPKVKYAEFVSMKEDEYNTLLSEFGADDTNRIIEILNNYKGATGKKYKSDYLAIRNWVISRLHEEKRKAGVKVNAKPGQSYDELYAGKNFGF